MTKVLKNMEYEFKKTPPEIFKGDINEWYSELGLVMMYHLSKGKMEYGFNSKDYNTVTVHPETASEYNIGMKVLKDYYDIIRKESQLILDDKMEKDTIKIERYIFSPYNFNNFREETLKTGTINMNNFKVKESPQIINITINIK